MKMPLLVSLQTFLGMNTPKEPTVSQTGVQARAIRHLVANGSITVREILNMRTNDAYKMIFRMRRMGVLYPLGHPKGEKLVANASGHGEHKVYKWTGKLPSGWEKPKTERRERARGGCR